MKMKLLSPLCTYFIEMAKRVCMILFFLLNTFNPAFATNYYVNSIAGNDASKGRSEATAWKSISKVNSKQFEAGDTIYFKRGCVWRETLSVPSSGDQFKNIVFSNYGKGPKPKILASSEVKSWIKQGDNKWKSLGSIPLDPYNGYFKAEIFFIFPDDSVAWGKHKLTSGDLTEDLDWTWTSNAVYIYSKNDPNLQYSGVEVPQRQQCINLKNKSHIHINGLNLFYSRGSGVSYDWSQDMMNLYGLIIENSQIAYCGSKYLFCGYGTEMAYSDMTIRNDTIHDCGRRGMSLDIYGSGFTIKNVLIENCVFYSGFHTTGIDLSVGSGSYNAGYDGVVIRRNLFFDDPATKSSSNQVFLQNYDYAGGGATVNNIYIYSNIFKYPSFSSVMVEGIQSCYIYNNTFYNHNITKSGSVTHIWIDAHNTSIKIKNNIFYSNLENDHNGNGIALMSLTPSSDVDADYNLYYRVNKSLNIINYKMTFNSAQLNAVRKLLKWELNSPDTSDPLFKNPKRNDFTLKVGSPAIGAGIKLPGTTYDYSGNNFSSKPSLGAFEFIPKTGN
jgi:hypothetical protein